MTSTNETVINFTMKELGKKIWRAMMKTHISYRCQNELKFPSLKRREEKYSKVFTLPHNIDIRHAIEKARIVAINQLTDVGIPANEQNFEGSLDIIQRSIDFEFVPVQCSLDSDSSDSSSSLKNSFEIIDSRSSETNSTMHITDTPGANEIYEAEKIFQNVNGELCLKNCATTNKHTFNISTQSGKVYIVKISTVVWMLSSGRFKCSNDRISRFQQPKNRVDEKQDNNQVFDHISCGDWVVFDNSVICHVSGFQYITGRTKTCHQLRIPIKCPETAKQRGVFVVGSFYELINGTLRTINVQNDKCSKMNLERYRSHLSSPLDVDTLSLTTKNI
ncbi:uncharacterized protein LOC128744041 [Sabethes cyaneus]|uniref:uncharacterized protein LOC128744041 n=1 Tax=Sabethes cyaneus TaxID=53552 RepID=UPI00237E0828|nr:uncharacterized protein LOC128744041 [Sabethes cyaneus]